jgi:hypothetical protein
MAKIAREAPSKACRVVLRRREKKREEESSDRREKCVSGGTA